MEPSVHPSSTASTSSARRSPTTFSPTKKSSHRFAAETDLQNDPAHLPRGVRGQKTNQKASPRLSLKPAILLFQVYYAIKRQTKLE